MILFPSADKPHMILQSFFHVEGLGALGTGQPHPLVVSQDMVLQVTLGSEDGAHDYNQTCCAPELTESLLDCRPD